MNVNQGREAKGKNKDLEAGKQAAVKDLNYKYNFDVNKADMQDFMGACKKRNTTAAKELRAFMTRRLATWDV